MKVETKELTVFAIRTIITSTDPFISPGKPDDEKESLIETGSPKIVIERTIFTQKTFDDQFEPGRRPTSTIQERTKRKISKYSCSPRCCKDFLFTIFPIMGVFKKYSIRQDLMGDLIAGLTVGIMHLPQGKTKLRKCVPSII